MGFIKISNLIHTIVFQRESDPLRFKNWKLFRKKSFMNYDRKQENMLFSFYVKFFEMLFKWLLWSINLKFPSVLKCHDLFVKIIWRLWAHQTQSSVPHVHIIPSGCLSVLLQSMSHLQSSVISKISCWPSIFSFGQL